MESASSLFAQNGLKGVSIRDIVNEAGANVALANYYFGSKEALYVAAATRYVAEVNKQRSDSLDELASFKGTQKRKLKAILAGYVMPHYAVAAKPGGMDYLRIFSRFLLETPNISKSFTQDHFGSIRRRYLDALQEVLTPISEQSLHRGFSFFVTNMLISPRDFGYELLNNTELTPDDLNKVGEMLVEYSAAGLWALRD
nr:TetR/AcrR family transcriptional regulator [Parahaliea mediterranea]